MPNKLDRLMGDARRRHFDAVLVARFDRFARSTNADVDVLIRHDEAPVSGVLAQRDQLGLGVLTVALRGYSGVECDSVVKTILPIGGEVSTDSFRLMKSMPSA
jgi:hypothetical protein